MDALSDWAPPRGQNTGWSPDELCDPENPFPALLAPNPFSSTGFPRCTLQDLLIATKAHIGASDSGGNRPSSDIYTPERVQEEKREDMSTVA